MSVVTATEAGTAKATGAAEATGASEAGTEIPVDLIRKYDVQSPRYTSYPPANIFSDYSDHALYSDYLRQRANESGSLSIYVHIPFCRDICYYCACNKIVTRDPDIASAYLQTLEKEIHLKSQYFSSARPVNQLHLGGGTPTFLDCAELMRLMRMLATNFQLTDSDEREYSIEVDPRTVNAEMLALLVGLGFNRISMGIQDFDPDVQRAINREQDYNMVAGLVDAVRQHGFKSLGFDLIYGLPLQTQESIAATLDKVKQLMPERISIYNYAHLPERFPTQRQMGRYDMPDAPTKLAMLQQIRESLVDAGYVSIGMDHYARPDDELALALRNGSLQRNFQGYATSMSQETIGLGVSAITTHPDRYVQNVRDLESYQTMLDDGKLPTARHCELKQEDVIRRHIIMNLACQMRLDLRSLNHEFGIDFCQHFTNEVAQLKLMEADGLLRISTSSVKLTTLGRQFLRNICMVFDQYHDGDVKQFSRAI